MIKPNQACFLLGLTAACLCLVGCPNESVLDADVVVAGPPGPIRIAEVRTSYVNILPDEVKRRLDAGEEVTIVDVRTAAQYEAGHLPTAISMPVATLPWAMTSLDKDKEVVVYCQTGATSIRACNILVTGGFTDVKNLVGGMSAWPYEVVTGSTTVVSV